MLCAHPFPDSLLAEKIRFVLAVDAAWNLSWLVLGLRNVGAHQRVHSPGHSAMFSIFGRATQTQTSIRQEKKAVWHQQ